MTSGAAILRRDLELSYLIEFLFNAVTPYLSVDINIDFFPKILNDFSEELILVTSVSSSIYNYKTW